MLEMPYDAKEMPLEFSSKDFESYFISNLQREFQHLPYLLCWQEEGLLKIKFHCP